MAINVSQAFHRTSANPVDDTMALTKAQMLTVNDNLMPDYYFTICQDDGYIYLYDKSATASASTGKFKKFEGGSSGGGGTSEPTIINKTLTAAGWSNKQQTINFNGYDVDLGGVMGVPTNATAGQKEAYSEAIINVVSQSGTSFTFSCENVPEIDLPVTLYAGGGGAGGGGSADFPEGGTKGQALVKASNADNDVEWGDVSTEQIQYDTMPLASEENKGQIIQYIGNTTIEEPIYENGHFYKSSALGTDPETYGWIEVPLALADFMIPNLPIASEDYLGSVYMYIGPSTVNYTHGYIYECKLIDEEYKWVQTDTQPRTNVPIMAGATPYADGATGTVPVPHASDSGKFLAWDGTWKNIYSENSGSTVIVMCDSSAASVKGKTCTITDGRTTLTATIDASTGEAIFENVVMFGGVSAQAVDDEDNIAMGAGNLTYFGTYFINLSMNYSIINLQATDSNLYGQTINVYKDGIQLASKAFNIVGQAKIIIEEIGDYVFESKVGNRFAKKTVAVEELQRVYNANVPLVTVFAVHYSENDSDPDSCDYPVGYSNSDWDDTFYIDLTTGTPHYGDWANELAKFLFPKPCMLKFDGSRDYYLDANDYTKKLDGSASDVTNTSYGGNAMMEWGQEGKRIYWTKIKDADGKGWTFIVGDGEYDGLLKPWNHYDINNNVNNHFYTPIYNGSNISSKLRSMSGQAIMHSQTATTENSLALANNVDSTKPIWQMEVKCDIDLINGLCVLISKSLSSQTIFGRGFCDSNESGVKAYRTGAMNDKGLFYGTSSGTQPVKIFGMENWYGMQWRRYLGHVMVNGTQYTKMTYGTVDGSTGTGYNFSASGYINRGNTPSGTSGGYINHIDTSIQGDVAVTSNGSDNTYYCDGQWYNNSGTMVAVRGGYAGNGSRVGLFYVAVYYAASVAHWYIGACPSCKPLVV